MKLNKADIGSPALGQGVVYRLKVIMTFEIESGSLYLGICCIKVIVIILRLIFSAAGLLCTEQDSSITVAFDDIPEEGLNSPLRLEKVANEV